MPERSDLESIAQVRRMRNVQVQVATTEFRKSSDALEAAEQSRDACARSSEAALVDWLRLLQTSPTNPPLVAMAADFSCMESGRLQEEELALSIAQNQLAQSQHEYTQALARQSVANKISAQLRKALASAAEERQSWNQIDLLALRKVTP